MLSMMRSQPLWSDVSCDSSKSDLHVSCCSVRTYDSFDNSHNEDVSTNSYKTFDSFNTYETRAEFEARQARPAPRSSPDMSMNAQGSMPLQPVPVVAEHNSHNEDVSTNSYKTFDPFNDSFDETRAELFARQEQIHCPAQGFQPHRSSSRPAPRSSPDMSMNAQGSMGATVTSAEKVPEKAGGNRLGKNQEFIVKFKSNPRYYEGLLLLQKDIFRKHRRPRTPDPTERESNNTWGGRAAEWRHEWAAIDAINCLVEDVSKRKGLTNEQILERKALFEDSKVAWKEVLQDEDKEKSKNGGKKHKQDQPLEAKKHALRKELALAKLLSQYFP